jgi:tetratricopeptide (TPR) repeat protein
MPRSATQAAKASSGPKAPLSGALTEAGRLLERYASVRLGHVPEPLTASVSRPSNSRVRIAREQAVLGVRLAQEGKHALAIERLRRSADLDPTVATVQHDLGLVLLKEARLQEAVQVLGRAASLAPELASAHLHLAAALQFMGRLDEALAAGEAAIRLAPEHYPAQARMAQIHMENGCLPQAEAAFRAAAAAAGLGSLRARLYEAHAERIAERPSEAQALLQAIIAADPACGEAYVALGHILAEAGRSDEAAVSFERGLSLDPDMAAAWYSLATSKKFSARDQALVGRMASCLKRTDLTPPQCQAVHFALGKVYGDTGDFAASMHHIDAANRIRGAHRRLDRALLERQTSHAIASAPLGFLDQRADLGVEDATPILIVGMPRSGTTLVEQILSSHPDVAAGGELGFWRERNRTGLGVFGAAERPETAQRLAGDYLKVLRAISSNAARVTDKMPFNFAHLGVIRQVFPRATIVHCRRHPIDTCLSIFATDFQIPYDFAADRDSLVFFYRQYQRLMAHWREVLPAERFIEVEYEALVADPEPLTRRLVETCGLEWNEACLTPHKNQRQILTASLWQARQPIYQTSVARWRRYEPWLGELRALLADVTDEARPTVRSDVSRPASGTRG